VSAALSTVEGFLLGVELLRPRVLKGLRRAGVIPGIFSVPVGGRRRNRVRGSVANCAQAEDSTGCLYRRADGETFEAMGILGSSRVWRVFKQSRYKISSNLIASKHVDGGSVWQHIHSILGMSLVEPANHAKPYARTASHGPFHFTTLSDTSVVSHF
jgi:hypothetical protein